MFVPSPRTPTLCSVCYRVAFVCQFAHLGMTPLSIFDCPFLVQPFNSLLINSLSLLVPFRLVLSLQYSANGRCIFYSCFPFIPPCCYLLSFIVLFVPSPHTPALHSVCYRVVFVCQFAHLGMTPLSIFDCPLLFQPFNSLLINSLSLFVLHYPLYQSFLSHPYSVNGRCETLPSCLDPLATRPSYFLHPALLLLLADRF